jgi:hypothetical protein
MSINELSSCPSHMRFISLHAMHRNGMLEVFLGGVIRQYPFWSDRSASFSTQSVPDFYPSFLLYPASAPMHTSKTVVAAWSRQVARLTNREQAGHSLIEMGLHPPQSSHTKSGWRLTIQRASKCSSRLHFTILYHPCFFFHFGNLLN